MTHSISRRTLMGAGLATMSLPAFAARPMGFFAGHRLPIGLQLYTVGDAAEADLQGTLGRIAALGFQTVELAGYHGHTPTELRAAADAAGLRFGAIHVGNSGRAGEPNLDGDLAALAADLQILGINQLFMPILPVPAKVTPKTDTETFPEYLVRAGTSMVVTDWQGVARYLNNRGAKLKALGISFGYHNHNVEFRPLAGGRDGMDVLLAETDPALVKLEMDAGWIVAGGHDPLALLRAHPQRFIAMHVKDIKVTTKTNYALQQDPTEVGQGIIDWKRILPVAYANGVRHFFVEQEPPFVLDRFEALGKSIAFLRTV